MVALTKCDSCLNSRLIVSENVYHTNCCLSDEEFMDCFMNKKDLYVENPNRIYGEKKEEV